MILTAEVGNFNLVNTYFYIDDETRHGFLIDPGDEGDKLLKICAENNFTIEKILITHGHYDHIGAVNQIQYALNIPAIMNVNGKIYAENPQWNCSIYVGDEIKLGKITFLDDGTQINLEKNPNFGVKMIHTPGHTLDGVIYYSKNDKVAFVGDTIFKNSYGRYDLPGGDSKTLFNSIRTKILTLPADTILLSGHTPATTVDAEKIFF
ncbi:MAG: MBL fold metallo-hydrolase [Selenomonadaceae bacterium]|nr:MBL fold metallo-hydrolase [Selenomonadaceae bacterium]